MALALISGIVAALSYFIIRDAKMDQREALVGRITFGPAPDAPPAPPAREVKGDRIPSDITPRRAPPAKPSKTDLPVKGDVVICKGILSNDLDTHAAIITRTWTHRMVNLMLLPDMGMPIAMSSVELFETRDEAENYIASLNGAKVIVAWRRNSPNVGSLK